ncbi:mechanosensitive ion channel [Nesterenkonia haasae]|uniref:mechanosensitive ion channel n=1 Tax=Nesterenkonia haasae TaxID=2587813 RepID=UPI001390DF5D|nr:mechanosensitive ion channel [Nesterenkonia haasae]NDK30728.1 hypothetical protein [Nesterenkonia haasae]
MDVQDYDWIGLIERVLIALVILLVTWLLAMAVKWAISKLFQRIPALQRGDTSGASLGSAIGQVAALVIWLLGLVAILQLFAMDQVLQPVQQMLNVALGYLPNIIAAAVIFFIGWILARIVKQLIEATLGRVNFHGLLHRAQSAGQRTGSAADSSDRDPVAGETDAAEVNQRITSTVANIVFAIIVILVAISALQVLGIAAISDPATGMLDMILNAVPSIIAAVLILAIGVVIAKFIGNLLATTLENIGTDRFAANLGVEPRQTSVSSILAKVGQVAIILFFAIMAARALDFPEITNLLNEVLTLGGRVLFGAAIIGVGFFIANLLARTAGSGSLSTVIRYGTLALFVAMGLQYMGIADSIINLAFGAVVVGGALAAALAFGLGGRDAAARQLNKMERKYTGPEAPPSDPLGPPRGPGAPPSTTPSSAPGGPATRRSPGGPGTPPPPPGGPTPA